MIRRIMLGLCLLGVVAGAAMCLAMIVAISATGDGRWALPAFLGAATSSVGFLAFKVGGLLR